MGGELSACCSCSKGPVILDVSARDSPQMEGEEKDDTSDKEEERPVPAPAARGRRAGIAAASVDRSAVAAYQAPDFEKDAATRAMLEEVIKKNEKMQVLFGHLKDAARASVVSAFFSRPVPPGEEIIRQGEEGDCLYIVGAGTVDVYVRRAGGDDGKGGDRGPKVVTLGSGALFGELALMYSAPRAATVVAASQVQLWGLDQEPFKMLLMQSSQQQYALYEGWLSQVDIFKALNQFELAKLSDILDSRLYSEDEVIITEGEIGDRFFLLEDGKAIAYIKTPGGEKEVKVYEAQGQYFGELALLNEEPRKATVRASGSGCMVASLTKEDFSSILGPIKDVLQKNAETYQRFAQHLS